MKKLPWARHAYLHTIYRPADPLVVHVVASDLQFPRSLVAHFATCNGGTLFHASVTCIGIHLFGCVPERRTIVRDPEAPDEPLDIRTPNLLAPPDFVVFGSYGYDLSRLMVNRQDETVRCSVGKDMSRIRCEWSSIDECLESEIERLGALFSKDGEALVPCEELLPPAQGSRRV